MSTLDPLESKQCPEACPTGLNRLRCYVSKMWCKALKVFEPLCALREVEFSQLERMQVIDIFDRSHHELEQGRQAISEALTKFPHTRSDYAQWLDLAQKHSLVFTAHEERISRGQLTGFNIIGLAMSYGTTCHCCLGWRAIATGIIGLAVGYWIGR